MIETVAYIFGIIGAIATVWNLYFAWKNDRFNSLLPSSKTINIIEEKNISIEEKEEEIKQYVMNKVITIDELEIAFRSVKRMHFAKPKDDALIEIVKKSVLIKEFNFAFKVCKEAHFAISLDEMLMLIVDFSIVNSNLKIAEKASNRFYYANNMDIAKRKIVDSVK